MGLDAAKVLVVVVDIVVVVVVDGGDDDESPDIGTESADRRRAFERDGDSACIESVLMSIA